MLGAPTLSGLVVVRQEMRNVPTDVVVYRGLEVSQPWAFAIDPRAAATFATDSADKDASP